MLEIRLLAAEQTTRYTGGFDYMRYFTHGEIWIYVLCLMAVRPYSVIIRIQNNNNVNKIKTVFFIQG